MEGFEEEKRAISINEMNALTEKLRELKKVHAEKARDEKAAKTEVSIVEQQILSALNDSDVDTFVGTGGRVTRVRKLAVRIPATPEDKEKLFAWLEKHQGKDVADHYKTINSQALNSLYNDLLSEYAAKGEVLEIDGLEIPTYRENLSFTKG